MVRDLVVCIVSAGGVTAKRCQSCMSVLLRLELMDIRSGKSVMRE